MAAAKDIKLTDENHNNLMGMIYGAAQAGMLMVIYVRRVDTNAVVPLLGAVTLAPGGPEFIPFAEILDPQGEAQGLYHEPNPEDNLPPTITLETGAAVQPPPSKLITPPTFGLVGLTP